MMEATDILSKSRIMGHSSSVMDIRVPTDKVHQTLNLPEEFDRAVYIKTSFISCVSMLC